MSRDEGDAFVLAMKPVEAGAMPHTPLMLGRYEVVARIGSGGMAEVFRARAAGVEGFEKTVVLKRVRPELARKAALRAQLVYEAKLCSGLVHPNIVQTFDLIAEEDDLFIVMEYVRGADVLRLLRRCTEQRVRIPPGIVVAVVAGVAKALAYAHNATGPDGAPLDLAHCDVSPSNILLSYEGAIKLADFGVARATSMHGDGLGPRRPGRLRGKLGYMAPEVLLEGKADARADVFALGAILWEMLTLRRLFTGRSPVDTMRNVAACNVEDRFARHGYVDPRLLEIVARAAARRPEDRYPTGRELLDALLDYLHDAALRVSEHDVAAFLARLLPSPHEEELDEATTTSLASLGWPAEAAPPPPPAPPPLPAEAAAPSSGDGATPTEITAGDLEALVLAIESHADGGGGDGLVAGGQLRDATASSGGGDQLPLFATFDELALGRAAPQGAAREEWIRLGTSGPLAAGARRVRRGHFDRRTVLAVLARLAMDGETGVATFESDGCSTRLVLQDGRLVHGTSDDAPELLGERLVREGYISAEQRERGLARSRAEGTRVGEALIAIQAVTEVQLRHNLTDQLARHIADLFGRAGGECTWEPGVGGVAPMAPDGVDLLSLLAPIVRHHLDPLELVAWLTPWRDGRLEGLVGGAPLERLALTDEERELARLIVARRGPVRQVVGAGVHRQPGLLPMAFLLMQTFHIRVAVGGR